MNPRYGLLVPLYCAALFWLSSQPLTLPPTPLFPGADKVVHMILYAGLAVLVFLTLHHSGRNHSPAVQYGIPIIFCLLYGISDEIHQLFVPTRSFDLLDILADTLGAALAQGALLIFRNHHT